MWFQWETMNFPLVTAMVATTECTQKADSCGFAMTSSFLKYPLYSFSYLHQGLQYDRLRSISYIKIVYKLFVRIEIA